MSPNRFAQSKPLFRYVNEVLRRFGGTRVFLLMSLYAPFLGAGIRICRVADDATWFEVELPLRFWNKNYFGTHFGGCLYAMTDPFFALILTEFLGPDYVVWDKEATIRFKRPGRGTTRARFEIPRQQLETIRQHVDRDGKRHEIFQTNLIGPDGDVIAEIEKTVSIRRKSTVINSA